MKILLSTIPSDSHTWNLVYMQLLIEEMGHEVINLGPCVPIDLLKQVAMDHEPHMIVISSINGHGNIDGVDIAKAIRASEKLQKIPLIIGGKLSTENAAYTRYSEKLMRAGFNGVFGGASMVRDFMCFLKSMTSLLTPNLQVA